MIHLAAIQPKGRATSVERTGFGAEADALEGLYERHAQRVFAFCLGQLRKREEAEDAAQTTFLYAFRALRRGVVPAVEAAWLLKIARNVCLSRFDASRRRGLVELPRDPAALAELAPARSADDAQLPHVAAALARLPERQRRAIVLREWQGMSYAEIAAELELSHAAVETLIFRARRALAEELGGEQERLRRRGVDLGSLLGVAKSLLTGGAAKVAVAAVAVSAAGAVAAGPVSNRLHGGDPARPQPDVAVTPAAARTDGAQRAPAGTSASRKSRQTEARVTGATVAPVTTGEAPTTSSPGSAAPAESPASRTPKAAGETAAPSSGRQPPAVAASDPAPASEQRPASAPAPAVAVPEAPSLPAVTVPTPTIAVPSLPAAPTVTVPSVPSVSVPSVTVPSVTVPSVPSAPSVPAPPTGGVSLP